MSHRDTSAPCCTTPCSRKSHLCDECARTINPGEHYSRTAAIWEGEWFTNVACLHCAAARYLVDEMDNYYNEQFYSGLSEWLGDNWYMSVEAARLKVCVDRKWQRFDGAGLMSLPHGTLANERIRRQMASAIGGAA